MSRKKKKIRELTDADIAACEPESIWLETRRSPLPAHCVFWAVVLLFVCGVLWACIAKVDKVVAAEGKLVTSRPHVVLKPLERTVVKSVDVRIGQVVEPGQTLISLDPTLNAAELALLERQYAAWYCRALRLRAELEKRENFLLPEKYANDNNGLTQQKIWRARRAFFEQKMRAYEENIERYHAIVESVQASLDKYTEMMEPMRQIEEVYENLQARGATARVDVFQVQMQRMGNEIEVENQRAHLVENQQLELTSRADARVFEHEWYKDISVELAEVELKLMELEEKMPQTRWLASMESIKSPCRGVVHEIAPYQEGSAVREAEAVITIIPLEAPMEAQVDILPRDVGLLRCGDTARIKFDAFPFQQHGTLTGKITTLSADTYESGANAEDNPDPVSAATVGRTPQYRALLTVEGCMRGVPDAIWQVSGMKIRAEIKVGEQRVISYLLNPFFKAMDESIREP